jgi:hypothetical protein
VLSLPEIDCDLTCLAFCNADKEDDFVAGNDYNQETQYQTSILKTGLPSPVVVVKGSKRKVFDWRVPSPRHIPTGILT